MNTGRETDVPVNAVYSQALPDYNAMPYDSVAANGTALAARYFIDVVIRYTNDHILGFNPLPQGQTTTGQTIP